MIKEKYLGAYMKTARVFAELSTARRKQVGAVVVKDDRIISIGYNGMPSGWDNNCEDEIGHVLDDNGYTVDARLKTKPEVLHAEMNCLMNQSEYLGCAILHKNEFIYIKSYILCIFFWI
jgi:dCMP deaminase